MTLLTDAEMTAMRAAAEQIMSMAAEIFRPQSVADGAGGQVDTWPVSGSAVSCRISSANSYAGDVRLIADRLGVDTVYMATFPAGTDIRISDRIEIAELKNSSGSSPLKLEVAGLRRNTIETAKRAICVEI